MNHNNYRLNALTGQPEKYLHLTSIVSGEEPFDLAEKVSAIFLQIPFHPESNSLDMNIIADSCIKRIFRKIWID